MQMNSFNYVNKMRYPCNYKNRDIEDKKGYMNKYVKNENMNKIDIEDKKVIMIGNKYYEIVIDENQYKEYRLL